MQKRDTDRAEVVTIRGKRIEIGMHADDLFELVSQRELVGQTIVPDRNNPPNLQFVKYYRIDDRDFAIELRKSSRYAPYTVTSILVDPAGVRPAAARQ